MHFLLTYRRCVYKHEHADYRSVESHKVSPAPPAAKTKTISDHPRRSQYLSSQTLRPEATMSCHSPQSSAGAPGNPGWKPGAPAKTRCWFCGVEACCWL